MHKSWAHHKNWRQVPHDCIIYFDVKVLSLFSKFFQLERFAVLSDMHKARGKENQKKKVNFSWVSFCRSNKFYLSIFGRSFTSNNASKENNRIILRNYREWRGWGWWSGVIKMECPIFFFSPPFPPNPNFSFAPSSLRTQQDTSWHLLQFSLHPIICNPGAPFSKVPKLFGHISGDIIPNKSSKWLRLEARNLAVILIFIPFTTYQKTSQTE